MKTRPSPVGQGTVPRPAGHRSFQVAFKLRPISMSSQLLWTVGLALWAMPARRRAPALQMTGSSRKRIGIRSGGKSTVAPSSILKSGKKTEIRPKIPASSPGLRDCVFDGRRHVLTCDGRAPVQVPGSRSLSGASGLASAVIPLAGAPTSLCRPSHLFLFAKAGMYPPSGLCRETASPVRGRPPMPGRAVRVSPAPRSGLRCRAYPR